MKLEKRKPYLLNLCMPICPDCSMNPIQFAISTVRSSNFQGNVASFCLILQQLLTPSTAIRKEKTIFTQSLYAIDTFNSYCFFLPCYWMLGLENRYWVSDLLMLNLTDLSMYCLCLCVFVSVFLCVCSKLSV